MAQLTVTEVFVPDGTVWPGTPGNPAMVDPDKASFPSLVADTFPGPPVGQVRGDAVDKANLNRILQKDFDCAVQWWRGAISDNQTLKLNFGWDDLQFKGFPANAVAVEQSTMGANGRTTEAVIRFDRSTVAWFLDDTPPIDKSNGAKGNEEFGNATETDANLGTALMPINVNVGRSRTANAGGDADGLIDLFSVALHEIGHALNIDGQPASPVTVTKNRGGNTKDAKIDLFNAAAGDEGLHSNYASSVMYPGINAGERRTLAGVDVLLSAELSDFTMVNLDPPGHVVPEPSTWAMLGLGIPALLAAARLRWRNLSQENQISKKQ